MSTPESPDGPNGSLTELLQKLESERATATVQLQTPLGNGQIHVQEGKIVDALVGETFGRPALLAVLGLADTKCAVTPEPASERRPALVESVSDALAEKNRRIDEWKALSKRAPSLSSIPALTKRGNEVLSDPRTETRRAKVLALIDGRRTLTEVIDQSGHDAIVALGWLVEAFEAGMAEERPRSGPRSSAPLRPVVAEQPQVVSRAAESVPSERKVLGGSKRRQTVMGLGVVEPSSDPPPAAPAPRETPKPEADRRGTEVRRVISITAPVGKPEAVAPRRVSGDLGGPRPEHTPTMGGASPVNAAQSAQPPVAGPAPEPASTANYIGRYELLFKIGMGGMGTVHLGRVTSGGGFRRLFAIKLLRAHLAQDGAAARKFLDEARLSASIHHPNVVSVVDAGFHGTQPYLVMDYIEGASVKHLLGARPPEGSTTLLLPIFLDALTGLHAAHSLVADDGRPLHLVHCDVSPENLLVGVEGMCRLTDFGVARHADIPHRRNDPVHGKPAYVAPEQILGGHVDRRTDIFSMGTVIYNALTGTNLFDGTTIEHTFDNILRMPIRPPSTVGFRPPPSLDFVCMKALERDPDRRFATAEEMMTEFRRVALRENLIAPVGEIARWVQNAVGAELAHRRSMLFATSGRVSVPPPGLDGPPPGHGASPPAFAFPPGAPVPTNPPADAAGADDVVEATDPLRLPRGRQQAFRHYAVIAASVMALLVVVITLLWPKEVSKLFRLRTDMVTSDIMRVAADPATPPSAAVPSAVPPTAAPPTATPLPATPPAPSAGVAP
jgi:eukaryotic-like serine/threonine-protein kinase